MLRWLRRKTPIKSPRQVELDQAIASKSRTTMLELHSSKTDEITEIELENFKNIMNSDKNNKCKNLFIIKRFGNKINDDFLLCILKLIIKNFSDQFIIEFICKNNKKNQILFRDEVFSKMDQNTKLQVLTSFKQLVSKYLNSKMNEKESIFLIFKNFGHLFHKDVYLSIKDILINIT